MDVTLQAGINSSSSALNQANSLENHPKDDAEVREAFDSFVGETFYGQMLSSMRKTLNKPAYFHGGRAEDVFQGQLDQVMTEHLTKASASTFTGPMYDLFTLQRG